MSRRKVFTVVGICKDDEQGFVDHFLADTKEEVLRLTPENIIVAAVFEGFICESEEEPEEETA